ncbi:hypothetical protein IT774_10940 [Salinimonas marina]|uniref:Uncharacterized protein n=1 Tax=Salinimonas marina TaxID=2785918 RepID=A0A7S9DVR1_9ALTE|nr:hypothetical protein [Salinimonas marina]QPG04727.1 hypothetical protein IT774_10940 [Salinimonas marina]
MSEYHGLIYTGTTQQWVTLLASSPSHFEQQLQARFGVFVCVWFECARPQQQSAVNQ